MKVFLGDLVHSWEKVGSWTIPLNIGFIAEYAKANLGDHLEFRLFKHPDRMIEAIKEERPEVVGLSHYVWNMNLNHRVFEVAKSANPEIFNVGGGPAFTFANANEAGTRKFFARYPLCDAYVVNQGEIGFAQLLEAFISNNCNLTQLRTQTVPGSLINANPERNQVHIGEPVETIRNLDEIPSPYLSGLLDEFFEEPFIPVLETNRSCPYRCTFCAWGIGTTKLAKFGNERVLSEIKYISERCKQVTQLIVADANFSILERDAIFADNMRRCSEKSGYPGHILVQWNKTRPDRVSRVARNLAGLAEIGASMQSLNPGTLAAIKRKNLPVDDVVEMVKALQNDGMDMPLFTEMILGLPEETWQSHIDANKTMIDLGAEVFNYNLHLLPGTEMDSDESRKNYFRRTGWRLHDNAFGIYDGVKIFEGQEVVLETSTMSFEELRGFRFIHFLIQFMWSRKWYFDYLNLFRQRGINPVDVIVRVAKACERDNGAVGRLFDAFRADHDLEHFETYEDLCNYWEREENLERLRRKEYGKLNYVFTFRMMHESGSEFGELLRQVSEHMVNDLEPKSADEFLQQISDVLHFTDILRVEITEDLKLISAKNADFNFDVLSWRESGYKSPLERAPNGDTFRYHFHLPDTQRRLLEIQLNQFRSENVNLTLRKMSEDTSPDQFFYQVEPDSNGSSDAPVWVVAPEAPTLKYNSRYIGSGR